MNLAFSLTLAKGVAGKLFYGGLIGGALGFCAGKMANSSSSGSRRLASHIDRLSHEISSDPELSIDLFGKTEESDNNNNYIDYKTSRRDFYEAQNDYNLDDDYDFGTTTNYRYDNRFQKQTPSYNIDDNNSSMGYDYGRYNYDIDNYTRRYDS